MKARLAYLDDSYHLLLCNGIIKKISQFEARNFIESYDSPEHYVEAGEWDYSIGTMEDYGGETIVLVDNYGDMYVKSSELFRKLLRSTDVKFLSVNEYAQKHDKQRAIVTRLCAQGRLMGTIKVGSQWCIPEDAPYPKDFRLESKL